MRLDFHEVYYIDGRKAIKLAAFAKIIYYSDKYLLEIIKNLFKKKIYIAYKWKRNYYIFLPTKPLKDNTFEAEQAEIVETPSGDELEIDWNEAIDNMPPSLVDALSSLQFSYLLSNNRLMIAASSVVELSSSTLSPKTGTQFVPLSLGKFPATTDYKYGYYIYYDEAKMSTFDPGTSGTLKSNQLPGAFFEICRALDAAENSRNGANPGLTPRRNISTTVSFDTGTIAVAATLPVTVSIGTGGAIDIAASDYLGSTYSTFANGGGDLSSDTLPEALLEMASLLAAAEKAVTPVENQPNNIQIQFDLETGSATISGNLPFTTSAATNGDVTVHAIDYL